MIFPSGEDPTLPLDPGEEAFDKPRRKKRRRRRRRKVMANPLPLQIAQPTQSTLIADR